MTKAPAVLFDRVERGPAWLWGLAALGVVLAPLTELLDIPGTAFYVPCVLWGASLAAHFTRLRIRVTATRFEWRFLLSPGWNSLPVGVIRSATAMAMPAEGGLGTRVTRYGQCHSTGAGAAVRIDPDTGDAFLIGTTVPDDLVAAIARAQALSAGADADAPAAAQSA